MTDNADLVVNYDIGGGSDCIYEEGPSLDTWRTNRDTDHADQFSCSEDGSSTGFDGSDSDYGAVLGDFCGSLDYSGFLGGDYSSFPGTNSMPAASYLPTKEMILDEGGITMQEYENFENGDCGSGLTPPGGCPEDTTWASSFMQSASPGWKPGFQSLYQAEKKYDGGTSETSCDSSLSDKDCHDVVTWEAIGDNGLQDTSDGYSVGERGESWTVGNMNSASNTKIGDSSFPGGFAGLCKEGNWVFDQEWTCSGTPSWKQAVMLPEVPRGATTVGMIIMPYNWKDTADIIPPDSLLNSYKQAWSSHYTEPHTSDQNLVEVVTTCYPSDSFALSLDSELKPESSAAEVNVDYFHATESIDVSSDEPLAVTGTVKMKHNETYTCHWEYKRQDGIKVSGVGNVVQLQKKKNDDRANYFTDGEGSDSFDGYDGLKTSYTSEELKAYSETH